MRSVRFPLFLTFSFLSLSFLVFYTLLPPCVSNRFARAQLVARELVGSAFGHLGAVLVYRNILIHFLSDTVHVGSFTCIVDEAVH